MGLLVNLEKEQRTAMDMFTAYDMDITEDSDSDAEWNLDEGGEKKEGVGGG